MKKFLIAPALFGAFALALGGCATPPAATSAAPSASASASTSTAPKSDFLACMVSDSGGWDDKSFNETSHKGLVDAAAQLGVQTKDVQSKTDADYANNVKAMIDAKCNIIVTVGFKLGDATEKAAAANPNVKFAIVDYAYEKPTANLKGLVFNTGEPSYLAGYLAASLSKTGKVGTYGGMKIPTVTAFMKGYEQGVGAYNKAKGKNVAVLGWSTAKNDGSFVPGSNPFGDVAGGKQVATNLVSQGADVLLPVAGGAGIGGLQVAKASGGKVTAMWVDTDGCTSVADFCSVLASSVGKAMDVAVFEAIKEAKEGTFSSDLFVGTLKNNGVYLAPFHDFDSKISAETKAELDKLKADIIAGTVKVG